MARVPAYPDTDAWLWNTSDVVERILARREAVQVGTLARKAVVMTESDLKKEVDWVRIKPGPHRVHLETDPAAAPPRDARAPTRP